MQFYVENLKGWNVRITLSRNITHNRTRERDREKERERENNSDVDTFYIFPLHTLKHIMKMK